MESPSIPIHFLVRTCEIVCLYGAVEMVHVGAFCALMEYGSVRVQACSKQQTSLLFENLMFHYFWCVSLVSILPFFSLILLDTNRTEEHQEQKQFQKI